MLAALQCRPACPSRSKITNALFVNFKVTSVIPRSRWLKPWNKIADLWACKTPDENGYYAFNDMHVVIALVGAGRLAEAQAMIAFAEQRYDDGIDALYPIRSIANRFGGSNAQRDILTQTLMEAAIRGDREGLATNLLSEREVHKPFSPLTRRFKNRLLQ
jgi:hypothetical protein